MSPRLAAAALVALAMIPRAARADSPRVSLRWTAPEGCPPGSRVVAEVDRLLGDAGARPETPLEVRAEVTADPAGGMRVRIETGRDGARVRELTGATCEALSDATAVIVALMIDPAAVAATPPAPPPAPQPVVAPPTVLPPPPLPAALPIASPKRPRSVRFHLGAWALADAGSLPGASFAAGGAAAISIGALRVEAGAGAFPAQRALVPTRPSAGGDVSLIAGAAGACYRWVAIGGIELAPCLALELGKMHASGFGVSAPGSGSALWSAAKVGGLFAWAPVARLALVLRVEAVVPFARPLFVLENVGEVHRAGPVAGRVGGGVEARF